MTSRSAPSKELGATDILYRDALEAYFGRVLLYDREHRLGRVIMSAQEKTASAFGLELADFAQAVLEGTPLAAGPEESLGELWTALAIYRSGESRQWEKVWDW